MANITVARPADYALLRGARAHNFIYPQDPAAITLDRAVPSSCTWELRGPWPSSTVAGSGQVTNPTGAPVITLDRASVGDGHYTLYVRGPDRGDGAWGTDYGVCRLLLARDIADFPRDPLRADITAGTVPDGNVGGQTDAWLTAVCGGPMRRLGLSVAASADAQNNGGFGTATNATAVACPMSPEFGGQVGGESRVVAIHRYVGAGTVFTPTWDGANPWTLIGESEVVNGMSVRVYMRAYGVGLASLTVTADVAGDHTIESVEVPFADPATALAIEPTFTSGTGTSADLAIDSSAHATEEHFLVEALATTTGTGAITFAPGITFRRADGAGLLTLSYDDVGDGAVRGGVATWASSVPWIAVRLAVAIKDALTPNVAAAAAAENELRALYPVDPARPRMTSIALGHTRGFEGRIAQIVTDFCAATGTEPADLLVEGRNEPATSPGGPLDVPGELLPLIAALDATGARYGGPMIVDCLEGGHLGLWAGLLDDPTAGPVLKTHVPTTHDYNSMPDPLNGVLTLRNLRAQLLARGVDPAAVQVTECGTESTFSAAHRSYAFPALFAFSMAAWDLIMGVPPQQRFPFYDRRGGYDQIPLWAAADSGPSAAYPLMRVYIATLRGMTQRTEWAMPYDPFIIGGIHATGDGADGPRVAVVAGVSPGLPTVRLAVTGAATVDSVDCATGVTTALDAATGYVDVPAGPVPTLLHVPAGVDVAPWRAPAGIDTLTRSSQVLVTSSADPAMTAAQVAKLRSPDLRTAYAFNSDQVGGEQDGCYRVAASATDLVVSALGAETIPGTSVAIACPWPWQSNASTITAMTVSTQAAPGGPWTQRAVYATPEDAVAFWCLEEDTTIDDYTRAPCAWIVEWDGQEQVHAVKVAVTGTSAGMWLGPTLKAHAATYGPVTDSVAVRAIQVYDQVGAVTVGALVT